MSYHHNPDYACLLRKLLRHGVKKWLLRGAERGDAQTLRRRIKRTSSHRIAKGLARVLERR